MDDRIFANKPLFHTWLWCLMKANHTDGVWVPVKCGRGLDERQVSRGQFIFGRFQAARELKLKPTTARNHIKKLEKLGFIDTKVDRQWTLVTIRNYDDYSGRLEESGHLSCPPSENLAKTQRKPIATSKELENVENEKNVEKESPPLPPKGKKRGWPDDFILTETMSTYAKKQGIKNPAGEFEYFQDNALAKGYKYVDWEKAWQNWCRSPYQQKGGAPNKRFLSKEEQTALNGQRLIERFEKEEQARETIIVNP